MDLDKLYEDGGIDSFFATEDPVDVTPDPYYSGERGVFRDLASSTARGISNVVELTGYGLKELGIDTPLEEGAQYLKKNVDIFKPDISEAMGYNSPVYSGLTSLPGIAITSIGTTAVGAGLGFATGGGPVGAALGGVAALSLVFGGGTYGQKKEEYLKRNPYDEEGASAYATKHALSEFGFEVLSQGATAATFGGSLLLTNLAKTGITTTARNMLKISGKDLLKAGLKIGAAETGSELATYYTQASADEEYGMGQGPNLEGFIETGVAAGAMSLVFGGLGTIHTTRQQNILRKALESDNTAAQTKAASIISKELTEQGNADLAAAWDAYTNSFIQNKAPIQLDDNFVELANKINNVEGAITTRDIASPNPEVQQHAVDKILESAGISGTGGMIEGKEQEIAEVAFLSRESSEYRKAQNTKLGAPNAELQTLQDEQVKAEVSDALSPSPAPVEDPVSVLDELYKRNKYKGQNEERSAEVTNFYRNLFGAKRELDALNEEVAQRNQEVATETYVKEKNDPNKLRRVVDFEKEIAILMNELEPDSNNLTEDAKSKVKEDVKRFAYEGAGKGDNRLLNYLIKQEQSRTTEGIGTLGLFLTLEDKKALGSARRKAKGAIKGSTQQKQAKDTVKKLEAKSVAAVNKAAKEAAPTATPVILSEQATNTIAEAKAEVPRQAEERFIAAEEGEATLAIPSYEGKVLDSLEEQEAATGRSVVGDTAALDNESKGDALIQPKVKGGAIAAVDTTGNAEDVINEVAEKTSNTLVKAILAGSPKEIYAEIKGIAKEQRFSYVKESIRKYIPVEIIRLYGDVIQPRIRLAMKVANPADSDGMKETDSLFWNEASESGNHQIGYHKSTDDRVEIIRNSDKTYRVVVNKKEVGKAKTVVEAKALAESNVPKWEGYSRRRGLTPFSKEQVAQDQLLLNEYNNRKPKKNNGKVVEEGKTVSTRTPLEDAKASLAAAKEMQAKNPDMDLSKAIARNEARVAELEKGDSATVKIRKNPENKANDKANYIITKSGKIKKLLSAVGLKKLEEANYDPAKAIDSLIADKIMTKVIRRDIEILEEAIAEREKNKQEDNKTILATFPNAVSALDYIIKNGKGLESSLARIIKQVVKKDKLNAIIIKADTTLDTAKHLNGVITLKSLSTKDALHEIVHAISVREFLSLDESHYLVKKMKSLMDTLEKYSLKQGLITQEQVDLVKTLSTSQEFKDNLNKFNFENDLQRDIAYALLNPKEFMSMVFSDESIQSILSKVDVKDTRGAIRRAYDSFIKVIRELLNIPPGQLTALEEAIRTTFRIAELDYTTESYGEESAAPSATIASEMDRYKKLDTEKTFKDKATDFAKGTEKIVSQVLQSTYEALHTVSVKLAEKVRVMDFLINKDIKERTDIATPFLRKYRRLDKATQEEIDFLINNYESEEARGLLDTKLKAKGLDKEFNNIIAMLKEMDSQAETFGLKKYTTIDFYFPRRVKDYEGLVGYLRNRNYKAKVQKLIKAKEFIKLREYLEENNLIDETNKFLVEKDYKGLVEYLSDRSDWGMIDEAIKDAEEKAAKNGDVLTDAQKAEVVSDMLRIGRAPGAYLRTPAGLKKRSVHSVNADMMQFYNSPIEALGMHIREMTERIEINRMLGITQNKELRKEIYNKVKAIEKEENLTKRNALIQELKVLEDKIPDMKALIEEGVGKVLADEVKTRKITEADQKKVKDLIRARITQVGTDKMFSNVRQLALLGTLTQLSTGLRNITDNVWGMYRYGMLNQLGNLLDTASRTKVSWEGRSWYDPEVTVTSKNIKELGLDFESPLREYSTMNNVVDKAIRMSGLMLVDRISKFATMESALNKFGNMSEEDFNSKWKEIFGDKTKQVYEDVKAKNITSDVRYLLFSEISDFQPISLSEMPQRYLTGGNWRIAYLLKTYSIKSANNFYRESVQKIRDGAKNKDSQQIKQGFKNLAHLGLLFVMLGAGDDWIIDWLNGKEPDFTDSMVESLLTLAITSKYTMDKSKQDGLVGGYMKGLLPPTGIFNMPYKDLLAWIDGKPTYKTIKMFPAVGTLYYNRVTEDGQKNIIDNHKRLLYEEYKDNNFKMPSEGIQEVNKRIREFNSKFKPEEKIDTLTPGSFLSIKKKELKKGL